MLETDAPYCEIKNTHAGKKFVSTVIPSTKKYTAGSMIKGRNEPANIR